LSDRPPRPDALPAEALARAVLAVGRHLARFVRKQWTTEDWRTYERERKRRWRAREAQLTRMLRTPTGVLRLLKAMAMVEDAR
jgi:hypothetical protein